MGSRKRRYVFTALTATIVVWAVSATYVLFGPRSYTSSFVLVLPGPGTASTMNVDSIGSASSTTSSVFSSPDMSPTENYRKILLSHRLVSEAAERAGELPASFPPPKVDLADQTKLITISTGARTPDQAVVRSTAIMEAFLHLLDALRSDEIAQREIVFRDVLAGYKTRLQEARDRLIEHQAVTGLVSLEQYGSMVSAIERLHDQALEMDSRLVQARAQVDELTQVLGTTPERATNGMVLRSDPIFQALLDQLAKEEAEIATLSGIRANGNPRVQDAAAERASILAKLSERGAELTGLKRPDMLKVRDISLRDERARLFERLISGVTEVASLTAGQQQLKNQIAAGQIRIVHLADFASRLENLRRDVQVAEAVFTSALARTDTSKADFFASYPMVQTLEPPTVPIKPSSPQPMLALGGGIGATFLIIATLVLAWLRLALFRKILNNA